MNCKVYIHPDYNKYRPFIEKIPCGNLHCEKVFCNYRNTVVKARWDNILVVIKNINVQH